MTSFKSAQLIADSHDADKVVFLMDRIELGTQSLKEYRSFADSETEVQGTENTGVLRDKLNSTNVNDTLIVTSIQKMSNVKTGERGVTQTWLDQLAERRIVFIVDECHRSTFGDMLQNIRRSFPTRCSSDLPVRQFWTKTRRRIPPLPWYSAVACTGTASPTAFVTIMYSDSTRTW